MIFWVFIGIGSGTLFSLILSNFFGFFTTIGKESNEEYYDKNTSEPQIEPVILESKPEPLNFQTLGSFFTVFGYAGALLYKWDIPILLNLILSGILGLIFAFFIFKLILFFRQQKIDSSSRKVNLIGLSGIVTKIIESEKTGMIEVTDFGKIISIPAKSFDRVEIPTNSEITISDFDEKGNALVSLKGEKT